MAIVVVGGHTRNIGKTSVMAGLISGMPEMEWTAFKITQFGHGVCSANGEPCECDSAEHPVAISEERERDSGTDSSRYLEAGAVRSLWVRTRQGDLAAAMPALRREMAAAENVIVESNSVLRFVRPDLYAAVLDPQVSDFKRSALRYLDRADALLLTGEEPEGEVWAGVSVVLLRGIRRFRVSAPAYVSEGFVGFARERLFGEGR